MLESMAEELATQDNCATENPIYVVQRRRRRYGFTEDYRSGVAWLSDEGECEPGDQGAVKTGYIDEWEWIQPFFTMNGALRYIAANKHNLGKARVFVASGHRNDEWKFVRELLMRGPS